jgi:site-specific recombinase XerD
LVKTTNPHAFGQEEIGAFMLWMAGRDGIRARPLAPKSQSLYLKYMAVFLSHIGNGIIAQMKARRLIRFPNDAHGPLSCPSEEQVEEIVTKLQDAAASGGIREMGVFGHTILCGYAGTRLKEVRLATKGDYSQTHSELQIYHVKGEGTWGAPRKVMIVAPGRLPMRDFMAIRDRELSLRGIADSKDAPLVPYFDRYGKMTPWPESQLNRAKCDLEAQLGIRYDFRSLRRSFGQNCLDRGARLDATSRALGHKNSNTTERYYARLRERDAFVELERVWNVPRAVSHIAST